MAEPLAVSTYLVGDPLCPGPEVTSLDALVVALTLVAKSPRLLAIAPGVALVHSLTEAGGSQVGNVFACRTDRESVFRVGLLSNPRVFAGIAAEVGLMVALILVPPFPAVFGLAPLSFSEWGVLLILPPAMLLLEEGRKWVVRTAGSQRRGS